jgi:ABC-type multidrug transport system fused ATPase/permease subunit
MNTATMNPAAKNAEQTAPLSQGGRVYNLFFAPTRTFADIRVNKSWWVPFLLTVICSYMLTLSGAAKIGFHQLTVNAVSSNTNSLTEDMLPEQRESTISTAETTLKISAFSAPVLILLYNVLYALVLWAGIALAGGQANFASIFAVLLYSDLIQNIRAIGSVIVLFVGGDPTSFNIQNALGTNPGFYIDRDAAPWLRTLLETMDLVTVWYLLLITFGCAVVGKISRTSSAVVVFGLWFVIVLARVSWAALN